MVGLLKLASCLGLMQPGEAVRVFPIRGPWFHVHRQSVDLRCFRRVGARADASIAFVDPEAAAEFDREIFIERSPAP